MITRIKPQEGSVAHVHYTNTKELIYESVESVSDTASITYRQNLSVGASKEQDGSGFIMVHNLLSEIKDMFIDGDIPSVGTSLELVLVKKEIAGDSASVVFKLRTTRN